MIGICCVSLDDFEEDGIESQFGSTVEHAVNEELLDAGRHYLLADSPIHPNQQDMLFILHCKFIYQQHAIQLIKNKENSSGGLA